jgi:hypothetical protein
MESTKQFLLTFASDSSTVPTVRHHFGQKYFIVFIDFYYFLLNIQHVKRICKYTVFTYWALRTKGSGVRILPSPPFSSLKIKLADCPVALGA